MGIPCAWCYSEGEGRPATKLAEYQEVPIEHRCWLPACDDCVPHAVAGMVETRPLPEVDDPLPPNLQPLRKQLPQAADETGVVPG